MSTKYWVVPLEIQPKVCCLVSDNFWGLGIDSVILLSHEAHRPSPSWMSPSWRAARPSASCSLFLQGWFPGLGQIASKPLSVCQTGQAGVGWLPGPPQGRSFCLACGQATVKQQVRSEWRVTLTCGSCLQTGRDLIWSALGEAAGFSIGHQFCKPICDPEHGCYINSYLELI